MVRLESSTVGFLDDQTNPTPMTPAANRKHLKIATRPLPLSCGACALENARVILRASDQSEFTVVGRLFVV